MLTQLKLGVLQATRAAGIWRVLRNSSWRRQRLLILCYHGVSYADEHLWNPGLYLSPGTFRRRLEMLRDGNYVVLPLDEALERLRVGTLPPKSVAITFDDGGSNFYDVAFPILSSFGWPVSVYLPTYYCQNQLPVFDVTVSYLLWKSQGQRLDLEGLIPGREPVMLASERVLPFYLYLRRYVNAKQISAQEKDNMACEIAKRLGQDYTQIKQSRLFHIMNPEETAKVSRCGVSIELHTHRHRTPRDRSLFEREIVDNRNAITDITGIRPQHFCYPSGDFATEYFDWLRELGVSSATTCELGLAEAGQNAFRLPRLLDTEPMTDLEFDSFLSGFGGVLVSARQRVTRSFLSPKLPVGGL